MSSHMIGNEPEREPDVQGQKITTTQIVGYDGTPPTDQAVVSNMSPMNHRTAGGQQHARLQSLQRTFGNGYVQRLLLGVATAPSTGISIRRCACGGKIEQGNECAACRAKRLAQQETTMTGIQTNTPNIARTAVNGTKYQSNTYQHAFRSFRQENSDQMLDAYSARLSERSPASLEHSTSPRVQRSSWLWGGSDDKPFCFVSNGWAIGNKTIEAENQKEAEKKAPEGMVFCHTGRCKFEGKFDPEENPEDCG